MDDEFQWFLEFSDNRLGFCSDDVDTYPLRKVPPRRRRRLSNLSSRFVQVSDPLAPLRLREAGLEARSAHVA